MLFVLARREADSSWLSYTLQMAGGPLRVFYSYSHADVRMLERLRTHMAMLRRQGLITEWYDREIEAGSEWRQEIAHELEAADVILLLVSANFLASDFCFEEEMTRAVERARDGEALLIGVMLKPVDGWESTPFAEFQLVPRGAKPITKWSDPDEGYKDVVESIRAALEDRSVPAVARTPPDANLGTTTGLGGSPATDEDTPKLSPELTEFRNKLFKEIIADPSAGDDAFLTPSQVSELEKITDPGLRAVARANFIAERRTLMLHAVAQNFRA